MKTLFFLFAALLASFPGKSQTSKEPGTVLTLPTDTLFWEIPELNAKGQVSFQQWESGDRFNTHFSPGQPQQVRIGSRQRTVTLTSPKVPTKSVFPVQLLHEGQSKIINVTFIPPFNPGFSDGYARKKGAVIFENTPVYELVNVVFALTEKGSRDGAAFRNTTDYYREVVAYFNSYKDHPLLAAANKVYVPQNATYRMYRESAYNYVFRGDKIVVGGPYVGFEEGNTLLDEVALWEDFARKSNFQAFYEAHQGFYGQEVANARKYLPVQQMWRWVEGKFPHRYHTYRIVISPLVRGFHSTQHVNSDGFNECIMFISDASDFTPGRLSARMWEGIYSGIVFTEIDHNYINPISDKYSDTLNKVFGNKQWITPASQAAGYGNGTEYFNEYLTHAVYLLYIEDTYTENELAAIATDRIQLMEERGFPRFKEFYGQLRALYAKEPYRQDLSLVYPELIKWGQALLEKKME